MVLLCTTAMTATEKCLEVMDSSEGTKLVGGAEQSTSEHLAGRRSRRDVEGGEGPGGPRCGDFSWG